MKELSIIFRLSVIVSLLALTSCKEISFEKPQPEGRKALTVIPKSLQGKYLTREESGELSKDTVVITANGYYFGYFDPVERNHSNDEYERGILSDTLVVKSYKGYYFLNMNERPEWLLRVIRQEKNGDLVYMTMEEENVDFKDYLLKLSTQINIDSTVNETETLYQIDPTPSELIDLIKKGFFSEARLVKVK